MPGQTEWITGLDSFQGRCLLGTDALATRDWRDQRVGVVAMGGQAAHIVPALVQAGARIKVFQCRPWWVLPQSDPLLRAAAWVRLPASPRLLAWRARVHLRRQVREPWLRRQLTPHGVCDGTRVLVSDDYYPALQAPHCKLLTWPIDRVAPGGIRTVEGVEHQLDCIVLALDGQADGRP